MFNEPGGCLISHKSSILPNKLFKRANIGTKLTKKGKITDQSTSYVVKHFHLSKN